MNRYLEDALELAARGVGRVSPNPAVGAVVVRQDQVVGRGFYTAAGVKHAEVLALEEAGEGAHGATLYVTLEPHAYHGRTPPCVDAILAAGIRKPTLYHYFSGKEEILYGVHWEAMLRLFEAYASRPEDLSATDRTVPCPRTVDDLLQVILR